MKAFCPGKGNLRNWLVVLLVALRIVTVAAISSQGSDEASGINQLVAPGSILALLFIIGHQHQQNRKLQAKYRKLQQERDCYKRCPVVDKAPDGMNQDTLQAVLEVAWKYSLSGIEGHRAGHILAVGPWKDSHSLPGACRGTNFWRLGEFFIASHEDDLMNRMNDDGAHVINGATGKIIAGRFLLQSSPVASSNSGAAGTAAAKGLSKVSNSVVFKISADGGIKEFRDGELYKSHCMNRPTIPKQRLV
jgi:DNA integrity scanning protein DisA with diadenylate cyclase activity